VPDDVAGRIERLRGSGEALPAVTRARMEEGFGTSFSGVRLHVGEEPARLNRLVSAEAFTVGRDVFFGAGHFDPGSPDGERVLAHELAHTLQPAAAVRRKPTDLAATPAATNADLVTGDAEWLALREATLAYSALAEDKYAGRAAKLVEIDGLAGAWEKIVRVPSTVEVELQRQTARGLALTALRALIATEHRELATAGMPVEESKQTVANRFKGDYLLEQVIGGRTVLGPSDKGPSVTKVQQALVDLADLESTKVTGTVDGDTAVALKKFQKRTSLTESGLIDQTTLAGLSTIFKTHGTEKALATGTGVPAKTQKAEYTPSTAPSGLLAGSRALSPDDQTAALASVKTRVLGAPGGVKPPFQPTVASEDYEVRLTALVERLILHEWNTYGKDKAGQRGVDQLIGWDRVKTIAARSKAACDAVFGSYAAGPPLAPGLALHDAWDAKKLKLQSDKKYSDDMAIWRVSKLLTGNQLVATLNREHSADPTRKPEKEIGARVQDAMVKKHYAKLLETHQGWPANAEDGKVFIQRFLTPSAVANRDTLWRLFGTIVHEYIHTLENSASKAYQVKLDSDSAFTLREGVVEYLTLTVMESVDYTDAGLRADVEGDFHVDLTHPVPQRSSYPAQRVGAEKLAGVVGAKNVMAAFFLGDVEKIGAKP
jgi:hypothetical protein